MKSARMLTVGVAVGMLALHSTAAAEPPQSTSTTTASAPTHGATTKQAIYAKLWKPLTVDIKDNSLADVLDFFTQATGLSLDVLWQDDKNPSGLSKETRLSLKVDRVPALTLLEKILLSAASDPAATPGAGGNAWQLTEDGVLQIGPKERLNAHPRTETYDINDLLIEITDFNNAPTFDLNQASQDSGGGGGSSPFQGGNSNDNQQGRKSLEERAQDLIKIIVDTVESEQWRDNGGNGATIKFWRGSLIVTAPEYIHRQIDGDGKGSSTTLKIGAASIPPSIVKASSTPSVAQAEQTPAPAAASTPAASQK